MGITQPRRLAGFRFNVECRFDKLRRVATYVYDIAFELAMADTRPLVDPDRWNRTRRTLRGAPRVPAAPLRERGK